MEVLGVVYATAMLLLLMLYWTVFPTLLNFVVSFAVAMWLARDRGWLLGLICFLVTSLMLTFGTRLPDFLHDATSLPKPDRSIAEALRLAPGDTLYLGERYQPVEQRGGYFSTPNYSDSAPGSRIVGPKFYTEDIVGVLRDRGLRLDFGEPKQGAPVLLLSRTETDTHQQLELTVKRDAQPLAHYEATRRLRFRDELGISELGLHLQHIARNNLWSFLLVVNEVREFRPLSNFIEKAIRVSDRPAPMQVVKVIPGIRSVRPPAVDEDVYGYRSREKLNCTHPDPPQAINSGLRTRIIHDRYELKLTWPTEGLPPANLAYGSNMGVRQIACGKHGYMVWIAGKATTQRIVLVDLDWRPVAAIDFDVPELAQKRRSANINFFQEKDVVRMEVYLAGDQDSGTPTSSVIAAAITHPVLESDYGGGARQRPSDGLDR